MQNPSARDNRVRTAKLKTAANRTNNVYQYKSAERTQKKGGTRTPAPLMTITDGDPPNIDALLTRGLSKNSNVFTSTKQTPMHMAHQQIKLGSILSQLEYHTTEAQSTSSIKP